MELKTIIRRISMAVVAIGMYSCVPKIALRETSLSVPQKFATVEDTVSSAAMNWREYFHDKNLIALIDTALGNNQELNIILQEINIAQNEVMAAKGEYLPFVGLGTGTGADKVGRYTRNGALEANNEIKPGKEFPEPLGDFMIGAVANWEVDIWRKLRTAKKSAYMRYLASMDGKNFMVTNLIAEIANSYYELLALDNQLKIVNQNIKIQSDALAVVKIQKQSARVTELAVRRFEAQVLDTKSLQFVIKQRIIETENRINFLLGRYPQTIARDTTVFEHFLPQQIASGMPSQLLQNRPDILQAEKELAAANMDIKVARANFYPSLGISASLGYQAFNPAYLVNTPESLLYSITGDVMAPLINRNAIKATYFNANAKQIQAVYQYDQTILNAYVEVVNQMSMLSNLHNAYDLKSKQVQALTESIDIANTLFKSARADYMEVLLTQRDALETKFELIETKVQQLNAFVNIYRALGGGWQ